MHNEDQYSHEAGATTQGDGKYQQRWQSITPGCLIILVDQSGSMEDVMGSNMIGAGQRKADAAAMVLNNVLNELQLRAQDGAVVKPRVDVAVLGYGPGQTVHSALGGNLAQYDIVSISDIANNPLRVNRVMLSEYNPATGGIDQIPKDVPIWVEAVADNGTPMCGALQSAYSIAEHWIASHPDNYPPLVLNITDGEANDGDPVPFAQKISRDLHTSDGSALVFNCHLSASPGFQARYPHDISLVPPDPLAQQLFQMSSVLPQAMVDLGTQMGLPVQSGARGFVYGADIQDMMNFITIASMPKMDPSLR